MARSILGHNLQFICEDGTVTPVEGEVSRLDEAGHAALTLGEYFRSTRETTLHGFDLLDLSARCITAQAFAEGDDTGLGYAALGLLSFGPAKDRNEVWERLLEPTRKMIDKRMLTRTDTFGHKQAFNIAKAVARFSMGLSKKDETSKLIDLFIQRINEGSTGGFVDDTVGEGLPGVFDVMGLAAFIFIRQALDSHTNMHLREHKLPSLRTFVEKYIKLMPDIVRSDGLAWAYGGYIGVYGQMFCISLILQGLRDGWIAPQQQYIYMDLLRRMFHYFFMTYLDQEHGVLIIRDEERNMPEAFTSRIVNFDAARFLCQWARLAKSIDNPMLNKPVPGKTGGRYVNFNKHSQREQGLFLYQNASTGLHVQLPLVASGGRKNSDYLAFPHCPGVFDWPVDSYLPILMPELTFGDKVTIPSYYGKHCVAGMGLRQSFYFRYEQPDLITVDEKIVPNIASCKVSWTFGEKVVCDFVYTVKSPLQMDRMRYVIALGAPHSHYRINTTFTLGEGSVGAVVVKDDFSAEWKPIQVVTEDPHFRTYYGKIHYLQVLERDHPLILRPGKSYRLTIELQPDIIMAE
ncbi:MAG: hypothetical protein A2Y14_03155 [Verrucomicrobia bacterium GWF2_51_19]|nr:MAG: hypothetical protein A2Y14_03155 [Verrucomicrobia bacterium GWF2_51_19]HCJ12363.1 hypothetical protein [Opitutae bacterium]